MRKVFTRPTKPRLIRGRDNPEERLQCAVVEMLDRILDPRVPWTAIAHGGFELPTWVAARLKRMGLKPGFADLLFVHPDTGIMHSCELKDKGGSLSRDQKRVHELLRNAKAPVTTARSVEEVERFLRSYDFPFRGSCLSEDFRNS